MASELFNTIDALSREKGIEEVIIAKDNKPLLRLVPLQPPKGSRKPGSAKGQVGMAPDFDETPEDFKQYT